MRSSDIFAYSLAEKQQKEEKNNPEVVLNSVFHSDSHKVVQAALGWQFSFAVK